MTDANCKPNGESNRLHKKTDQQNKLTQKLTPYEKDPYPDGTNDRRHLIYQVAYRYLEKYEPNDLARHELAEKTVRLVYNHERESGTPTTMKKVNDAYIRRSAYGRYIDSREESATKGYGHGLDVLDRGKHQQGKMVKVPGTGVSRQGRDTPPFTMANPYPSPESMTALKYCLMTCPELAPAERSFAQAFLEGKSYADMEKELGTTSHALEMRSTRLRHAMATCRRDCGYHDAGKPAQC